MTRYVGKERSARWNELLLYDFKFPIFNCAFISSNLSPVPSYMYGVVTLMLVNTIQAVQTGFGSLHKRCSKWDMKNETTSIGNTEVWQSQSEIWKFHLTTFFFKTHIFRYDYSLMLLCFNSNPDFLHVKFGWCMYSSRCSLCWHTM